MKGYLSKDSKIVLSILFHGCSPEEGEILFRPLTGAGSIVYAFYSPVTRQECSRYQTCHNDQSSCHGFFPETAVRGFFLKYRQLVLFKFLSSDQECVCELIHRTLKLIV